MKEHKIIVEKAFPRALSSWDCAENRIQSLIDDGWEVEKLKCATMHSDEGACVVAYLSRETEWAEESKEVWAK